jgi:predicted DNA-binding protein (MmcQ/YjbR family)
VTIAIDRIREYCMSLPHAIEKLQWGECLVFKIAGKMFAVLNLDPRHPPTVSFKCAPEKFYELTEIPGIIPAPYLARSHWVAVEQMSALRWPELQDLLGVSYQLVLAKLPRRVRAELDAAEPRTAHRSKPAARKASSARRGSTARKRQ